MPAEKYIRLSNRAFALEIQRLRSRVAPLGRFVHEFAKDIEEPRFFRTEESAGFRYLNPNHRHFCVIRAARIVSSLNAALCLAESGFIQEVCVLLRTIYEYCTQVDVVLLSRMESSESIPKVEEFLNSFFADDRRIKSHQPIALGQAFVHNALGARLDELAEELSKPTSELMSKAYLSLSYYVHGRYPESMDLFGGREGHFHLNGMRNTPKDNECIEILETYIDSASICFANIAMQLQLRRVLNADPIITDWYRARVSSS